MRKVYLAGAIFGLTDRGQTWREAAIANMPPGWEAINPNLVELDKITPQELVKGDFAAILTADAIIARVKNPSWGTAMELLFAHQCGVPVIAWGGPAICSPWLTAHVSMFKQTLEEAIGELKHVGVYHSRLVDSHR